jgi:hypothetical protein
MKCKDLTGQKFGRLTVLELARKSASGKTRWLCECECGNTNIVQTGNLNSGHTKSCGCLLSDLVSTHGKSRDANFQKEYHAWERMRFRCLNENDPQFKDYGGRGIKICSRWDDFNLFLEDIGKAPTKGHSIDRIDNDGGYNPDNCGWSTRLEQSRNSRTSRNWTIKGKTFESLSHAAKELGVAQNTIAYWCGRHHLSKKAKIGCYSTPKYTQEKAI